MACSCRYRKKIRFSSPLFDQKKSIYLDYNATTPVDVRVLGEIDRANRIFWANPSSVHSAGVGVYDMVESKRKIIADFVKTRSDYLYFCGSGTEGLGIFINHFFQCGFNFITTPCEHSSIIKPITLLGHSRPGRINICPVDSQGQIDEEKLEHLMKESGRKKVLFYSPVNHETGVLQNSLRIYEMAVKYGVVVVIDGIQTIHRLAPEDWALYCDFGVITAHKIYGPKGIAAFYSRAASILTKIRSGGSQEKRLVPGTINVSGIAGFGSAVELLNHEMKSERQFLKVLSLELRAMLVEFGDKVIIESPENSVQGILNISLPTIDDIESLVLSLDRERIMISRFSSCTGSLSGPSKVLLAMGRTNLRASSSLRISMGRFTKRGDLFGLVSGLKKYL